MSVIPFFTPVPAVYALASAELITGTGGMGGTAWGKFVLTSGGRLIAADTSAADIGHRDLSTSGDISSGGPVTEIALTSPASSDFGQGLAFNGDGTKLFWAADNNRVEEHALSSAYGGTATFTSYLTVSNVRHIEFNADGTELFILQSDRKIYKYALSSGYDLSTAGAKSAALLDLSSYTAINSFSFAREGSRLVASASSSGTMKIIQCTLSTAHDPSTAGSFTELLITPLTGSSGLPDSAFYGATGQRLYVAQNGTLRQLATVN